MHELSIIASIVDSVTQTMAAYPGSRVKEVRLRVGALASVIEDSLQFCYEIATQGTPLANHPGLIVFKAHATNANSGGQWGSGTNTYLIAGNEHFEGIFRPDIITNVTTNLGLHNQAFGSATAPTAGG